jgi:PAS domain-containing protein
MSEPFILTITNAVATIWLSLVTTLYLVKIERERPGEGRGVLDIVFAFLGSYGKARMLERNLLEWEGRYRMVVENASDMILMLDGDNRVIEANLAAMRIFNIPAKELIMGRLFPDDFLHPGLENPLSAGELGWC